MAVDCLTSTCIPLEMFLGFMVLSVSMAIIGLIRQPQIPAMITFAGMFILTMTVVISGVIMGKVPESSTLAGATTNYVMVDNVFEFTNIVKVLFALMSAVFILTGAIMVSKS